MQDRDWTSHTMMMMKKSSEVTARLSKRDWKMVATWQTLDNPPRCLPSSMRILYHTKITKMRAVYKKKKQGDCKTVEEGLDDGGHLA